MAKCKICKKEYVKKSSKHMVCSYECSLAYAELHLSKKVKEKKAVARKELQAFNNKDKTVLKQKAQNAFNKYIRLRDRGAKCISCNKPIALYKNNKGIFMPDADAGHFYSRGSYSSVRFNTNNVWVECKSCNRFSEIHLLGYEKNLLKKIGQLRYDKLKEESKKLKKYDAVYYQRIINIFNKKSKILEKIVL